MVTSKAFAEAACVTGIKKYIISVRDVSSLLNLLLFLSFVENEPN